MHLGNVSREKHFAVEPTYRRQSRTFVDGVVPLLSIVRFAVRSSSVPTLRLGTRTVGTKNIHAALVCLCLQVHERFESYSYATNNILFYVPLAVIIRVLFYEPRVQNYDSNYVA